MSRASRAARAGRIALLSLEWLAVIVLGLLLAGLVLLFALLWWPYDPPEKVGMGASPPSSAKPESTVVGTVPKIHNSTAPNANSSATSNANNSASPKPNNSASPQGSARIAPNETGSATTPAAGSPATPASGIAGTPLASDVALFAPIYQVLQSPRCMNCHPAGDRPLWRNGEVHAMNMSRTSFASGLACKTCHQERNADELGIDRGPPGAPHWQLPPKDMPMVFQGRSLSALCRQLRDPAHNGGKTLEALLHHVRDDPLVLWGWKPGGDRKPPSLSHADFVKAFAAWVAAEGRCPGDHDESRSD